MTLSRESHDDERQEISAFSKDSSNIHVASSQYAQVTGLYIFSAYSYLSNLYLDAQVHTAAKSIIMIKVSMNLDCC